MKRYDGPLHAREINNACDGSTRQAAAKPRILYTRLIMQESHQKGRVTS